MYKEIIYEVTGSVATIRINRPAQRNAVTFQTIDEIRHAVDQAERDEGVFGIVLTGEGDAFCAGMDMRSLGKMADQGGADQGKREREFEANPGCPKMKDEFAISLGYLMTVRKPLIAAVSGPCVGVGLALALLCDMRFTTETGMFTSIFARRGLIAETGMSWILPRLIGSSRALDLLWTGRKVDGREAVEMGLADRLFEQDHLLEEAHAYIEGLAATSSPRSVMVMKQQVYRHMVLPFGEAMRDTLGLMEEAGKQEDFKEGISSFVEKRPPNFPPLKFD